MKDNRPTVTWEYIDILELRPNWTRDQAEEWLRLYRSQIEDRMVSTGWELIENLLTD